MLLVEEGIKEDTTTLSRQKIVDNLKVAFKFRISVFPRRCKLVSQNFILICLYDIANEQTCDTMPTWPHAEAGALLNTS